MKCRECGEAEATHAFRCDDCHRCADCGATDGGLVHRVTGLRCAKCHAEWVKRKSEENEDLDTEYTNAVVCPWCGFEDYDTFEYRDGETNCGECEQPFHVERFVDVRFTTKREAVT